MHSLQIRNDFAHTNKAEAKEDIVKYYGTARCCCIQVLITGAIEIIVVHICVAFLVVLCRACTVGEKEECGI